MASAAGTDSLRRISRLGDVDVNIVFRLPGTGPGRGYTGSAGSGRKNTEFGSLYEGWLWKRGGHFSTTFSSTGWKRRWCVLTTDCIFYFRYGKEPAASCYERKNSFAQRVSIDNEEDIFDEGTHKELLGVMPILNGVLTGGEGEDGGSISRRFSFSTTTKEPNFPFSVKTPDRELKLAAET